MLAPLKRVSANLKRVGWRPIDMAGLLRLDVSRRRSRGAIETLRGSPRSLRNNSA